MKLSELDHLIEKGIIPLEQRELILTTLNNRQSSKSYLNKIFMWGAMAFIFTGLILIIFSHWDEIYNPFKIAIGALLLILFWTIGLIYYVKKPQHCIYAEVFCGLGALMWGINIPLYNSVYQLSNNFIDTFLFFIGLFAIPFIIKLRFIFLIVFAWSFFIFQENYDYYLQGFRLYNNLIYVLICLSWITFGEYVRTLSNANFLKSYHLISWVSYFVLICLIQANRTSSFSSLTFIYNPESPYISSSFVFLSIIASIGLGYTFYKTTQIRLQQLKKIHANNINNQKFHLYFSSVLLFIFTISPIFINNLNKIYLISFDILFTFILFYYGQQMLRLSFFNLGILSLIFVIVNLSSNLFDNLTTSGIFSLLLGLLFLGIAYKITRQYRHIRQKIKTENQGSSTTHSETTPQNNL